MIDKINIGSLITLTDPVTIESMMEEKVGNFTDGLDLNVKSIYEVNSLDETSSIYIYEFEEDINIYLMIKKLPNNDLEFYVLFKIPEFEEGSRQDMLDNGLLFLFHEPDPEEDWTPADLKLSKCFEVDGEGIERVNKYFGKYYEKPAIENMDYPLFSEIAEYKVDTNEECVNPYLMLLESGQLDEDDDPKPQGGWMEFYRGRTMKECDLEVL